MSSRRRSTMSASAPAGNPTRKTGRLVAACTSATTTGEGVREVISHAAPTFCIHVPIFDVSDAIQRARNTGSRSGSHAETPGRAAESDWTTFMVVPALLLTAGPLH